MSPSAPPPTASPFAAAVFDLDGTLVDNMRFHGEAWRAFCARHRIAATLAQFERQFAGKKNEEILPVLFGRALTAEETVRLAEEKEEDYRRAYRPHLSLLNGAEPLLRLLREHGLRSAIATAAPPANRDLVLDGLGLRGRFDAVVGAEQVARGKPFPDLFLAAAEAVSVAPARCMAFEDAVNGIRSAKAAGMVAVGVTTLTPGEALREAGADYVIKDFTELLSGPLQRVLFG